MGQKLSEIAEELRDNNQKVHLIYAFNGSGKTRLSRALKHLIDPRNDGDEDPRLPKVLYYNAFTEDLFYWDNDLSGDIERKLCIHPNAYTKSAFEDLGLDLSVVALFQRYTNTALTPRFNVEYQTEKDGEEIIVPAFSEVTFSIQRGDDDSIENIKISKGEESNFIWSIFYCLLEQAIDARNVPEADERETNRFNTLEYVFIDDPVSSLDDNHLIQLAVDVAALIRKSAIENGLRFIITTHNPLFYNVLFNELNLAQKKDATHLLKRLDNGTFALETKKGDSNKSFSYHLYLKQTLEAAVASDTIERFHFTLLRNLYEKTASFLGYPKWSQLLPEDQTLYFNRIIQFTSHSTLSNESVAAPSPEERQTVRLLLEHLLANYSYWQEEVEDA